MNVFREELKRQSYYQYVFSRIEFQLAVGLFIEFDYETKLRSDFDVTDDWEITKTQILKMKPTAKELADHEKYDIMCECMQFAKPLRMNPNAIANTLKPYIEELPFIDRVEIVGGYMNFFLDRTNFLLMVI